MYKRIIKLNAAPFPDAAMESYLSVFVFTCPGYSANFFVGNARVLLDCRSLV